MRKTRGVAITRADLESCDVCGFHRSVHDGKNYTLDNPKKLSKGVIVMPCSRFVRKRLQKEDEVLGEHLSTDHATRFLCTRNTVIVKRHGRTIAKFKRAT